MQYWWRFHVQILVESGPLWCIRKQLKSWTLQPNEFIAGYEGQTTRKTEALLNRYQGGIIFIDEAHQLVPDKNSGGGFKMDVIKALMNFITQI